MRIPTFEFAQFQPLWEHTVDYDLARRRVAAYTSGELLGDDQRRGLPSLRLRPGSEKGYLAYRLERTAMFPVGLER